MRLALAGVLFLSAQTFAQTTTPVVRTIVAEPSSTAWAGWAKSERSIPGWSNTPPEPGTVTVSVFPAGKPREFSGQVDGLAELQGAEVGVVSIYQRTVEFHLDSKQTLVAAFIWPPGNSYPIRDNSVTIAPGVSAKGVDDRGSRDYKAGAGQDRVLVKDVPKVTRE